MAVSVSRYADPVTAQSVFKGALGDRDVIIGTLTFDNSYPTGGEALTPAILGFQEQIDFVLAAPNTAGSRLVTYDRTNKKLLLFTAVGTEAANASDQSTIAVPFIAVGK